MITRNEITKWSGPKSRSVMLKIFEAAKRDLSVNDGTIPDTEVLECLSVMEMMTDDIKNHETTLAHGIEA